MKSDAVVYAPPSKSILDIISSLEKKLNNAKEKNLRLIKLYQIKDNVFFG